MNLHELKRHAHRLGVGPGADYRVPQERDRLIAKLRQQAEQEQLASDQAGQRREINSEQGVKRTPSDIVDKAWDKGAKQARSLFNNVDAGEDDTRGYDDTFLGKFGLSRNSDAGRQKLLDIGIALMSDQGEGFTASLARGLQKVSDREEQYKATRDAREYEAMLLDQQRAYEEGKTNDERNYGAYLQDDQQDHEWDLARYKAANAAVAGTAEGQAAMDNFKLVASPWLQQDILDQTLHEYGLTREQYEELEKSGDPEAQRIQEEAEAKFNSYTEEDWIRIKAEDDYRDAKASQVKDIVAQKKLLSEDDATIRYLENVMNAVLFMPGGVDKVWKRAVRKLKATFDREPTQEEIINTILPGLHSGIAGSIRLDYLGPGALTDRDFLILKEIIGEDLSKMFTSKTAVVNAIAQVRDARLKTRRDTAEGLNNLINGTKIGARQANEYRKYYADKQPGNVIKPLMVMTGVDHFIDEDYDKLTDSQRTALIGTADLLNNGAKSEFTAGQIQNYSKRDLINFAKLVKTYKLTDDPDNNRLWYGQQIAKAAEKFGLVLEGDKLIRRQLAENKELARDKESV